MSKTVLIVFAIIFSIGFAYIPVLFGDHDLFSGWSILAGTIGGIIGIIIGVWVSKRWL